MVQGEATIEGNCQYTSTMHLLNLMNYPHKQMNIHSEGEIAQFRRWCAYKFMELLMDPRITFKLDNTSDIDCKYSHFTTVFKDVGIEHIHNDFNVPGGGH